MAALDGVDSLDTTLFKEFATLRVVDDGTCFLQCISGKQSLDSNHPTISFYLVTARI